MTPTKDEIKAAMDVLKAAKCTIDTNISDIDGTIVFVVYVPLYKMENL